MEAISSGVLPMVFFYLILCQNCFFKNNVRVVKINHDEILKQNPPR